MARVCGCDPGLFRRWVRYLWSEQRAIDANIARGMRQSEKDGFQRLPSDPGDTGAPTDARTPVAKQQLQPAAQQTGLQRAWEAGLGARTQSVLKRQPSSAGLRPGTPLDPTTPRNAASGPSTGQVGASTVPMAQTRVASFYYQKVPGKSRFLCGGRCMLGPEIDNNYMLFAWCAILIPSGFFFWLGAPVLWREWGPTLPSCVHVDCAHHCGCMCRRGHLEVSLSF